jgi:hypothetical protein
MPNSIRLLANGNICTTSSGSAVAGCCDGDGGGPPPGSDCCRVFGLGLPPDGQPGGSVPYVAIQAVNKFPGNGDLPPGQSMRVKITLSFTYTFTVAPLPPIDPLGSTLTRSGTFEIEYDTQTVGGNCYFLSSTWQMFNSANSGDGSASGSMILTGQQQGTPFFHEGVVINANSGSPNSVNKVNLESRKRKNSSGDVFELIGSPGANFSGGVRYLFSSLGLGISVGVAAIINVDKDTRQRRFFVFAPGVPEEGAFGPFESSLFCGNYSGTDDHSSGVITAGGTRTRTEGPDTATSTTSVSVEWSCGILPEICEGEIIEPFVDADCNTTPPPPCLDDNGQPLPPCCCNGTCSGEVCNEIVEPVNCCPTSSGVFFDDTAYVDFLTSWSFRRDLCSGTEEVYEGFAIRSKPVTPGSQQCAQREAAMTLSDPGSTRQSIHFLRGAPTEIVNVPFFLTARLGQDPNRIVQFRLRNRNNNGDAITFNVGIDTNPCAGPPTPPQSCGLQAAFGVPLPNFAGGQKYLPGPGFLLGMTFVYVWDQPILTCPTPGGTRWTGELVVSVIGRREGYCDLVTTQQSLDVGVRLASGMTASTMTQAMSALLRAAPRGVTKAPEGSVLAQQVRSLGTPLRYDRSCGCVRETGGVR